MNSSSGADAIKPPSGESPATELTEIRIGGGGQRSSPPDWRTEDQSRSPSYNWLVFGRVARLGPLVATPHRREIRY